jgi:hypothetical protein
MPPEICPSLFYIVPDKETKPYDEKDIFKTDGFKVLQAENLTKIKEIVAHTAIDQPLQVRLLCCYRMKGLDETYCTHRSVNSPTKQVCSNESGINTSFIHFHIKMKDQGNIEYLLAFMKDSELQNNTEILIKEMFCSIAWLEIESSDVLLNVFTFGELFHGTRNTAVRENRLNSAKNKVAQKYNGTIDCKITYIGKEEENRLSVSPNSGFLVFNPS